MTEPRSADDRQKDLDVVLRMVDEVGRSIKKPTFTELVDAIWKDLRRKRQNPEPQ